MVRAHRQDLELIDGRKFVLRYFFLAAGISLNSCSSRSKNAPSRINVRSATEGPDQRPGSATAGSATTFPGSATNFLGSATNFPGSATNTPPGSATRNYRITSDRSWRSIRGDWFGLFSCFVFVSFVRPLWRPILTTDPVWLVWFLFRCLP